jgi:hypothetical protein
LKVGPEELCPYCNVAFPDRETVDALPAPANPNQETLYATAHHGMRFGTPPLFRFPLSEWYLCILHKLLRCAAVTFQRTIEVNLDTKEKVDAINLTKLSKTWDWVARKWWRERRTPQRRKTRNPYISLAGESNERGIIAGRRFFLSNMRLSASTS